MEQQREIKSARVYRFVEEYAKDRNGTQAAIRAGYSQKTAGEQACVLLKNPKIQALVEEQVAKVGEIVAFEAADVLREWVLLATADPSKISHVRRVNCRHCWGAAHAYQWKPREYAEACDEKMRRGDPVPDCSGGFDFVLNREPNEACPECEGEGVEETFFEDMRTLGPAERKLIAGVKRTKEGIEVKLRDQDGAIQQIAKYLGLLVEKRELTGKNGAPLGVAVVPVTLPDDPQALGALYSQIVGGG
jgi:hypothetical protein